MDTQHFKTLLEQEQSILEGELARLGIKDPETGDWGVRQPVASSDQIADEIDLADRDEDFTNASTILGELEVRYRDVMDALQKIQNGGFGICEVSGNEIELDRLEANPAARTCKAHME